MFSDFIRHIEGKEHYKDNSIFIFWKKHSNTETTAKVQLLKNESISIQFGDKLGNIKKFDEKYYLKDKNQRVIKISDLIKMYGDDKLVRMYK